MILRKIAIVAQVSQIPINSERYTKWLAHVAWSNSTRGAIHETRAIAQMRTRLCKAGLANTEIYNGRNSIRLQKPVAFGPAGSRRGIAKFPWERAGGQGLRVVG